MKVAVIIPCLNEAAAIAKVVADCRVHLPYADVYVLDNGSEDDTALIARDAGAHVIHSPLRGKGNVLRHAFRVLDADYFLLVDGDGTYPLSEAERLLQIAREYNYEMVMGSRLKLGKSEAFRPLHYLGNLFFTGLVRVLFNFPVQDLLTGYRVFSRRFACEMKLLSRGFEIETELTIRAMAQNLAFCEVPIPYGERLNGGKSKLRTFRDGWRILGTVIRFLMYFRPLLFFGVLGSLLGLMAWGLWGNEIARVASSMGALFWVLGFYLDWQLNVRRLHFRASERSEHVEQAPSSKKRAA